MTTTTWTNKSGGDFNIASNWSAGVPGSGDTASITAKGTYTVTDSATNTIGMLATAKGATLALSGGAAQLTVASGTGTGTAAVDGTITLDDDARLDLGTSGGSATFNNSGRIEFTDATANLYILGSVTLAGKGAIGLSGGTLHGGLFSDSTLTNGGTSSGNTISGFGTIGDATLSLVNGAKGTIDANSSGNDLTVEGASVSNSGLMEASGSGVLDLQSNITQSTTGKIEANAGATVGIDGDDITIGGGTVSIAKNGILLGPTSGISFVDQIGSNTTVTNDGMIESIGVSELVFAGSVKNSGLLYAAGGAIAVDGSVTGGTATIGAGNIYFGGPSSTKVTFAPNATGILFIDATGPSEFTGSVAGWSGAPGAAIDLENISYFDGRTVNYNPTKHLLTVTDPVTHVTDNIKIVGTPGSFTTQPNVANFSTLISDPPAGSASVPDKSAQLLAQSMASFGATSSIAGPGSDTLADDHRSSNFLASPLHG